jgi:hypothetical protein
MCFEMKNILKNNRYNVTKHQISSQVRIKALEKP